MNPATHKIFQAALAAPFVSAVATPVIKWHSTILKPFLPALFFFGGVTFDTLTLTRIDRLFDNLILLLYLTLLGSLIILTGRFQLGLIPSPPARDGWNILSLVHRARPHLAKALQFLLGGLFSAYVIFYSQSVSFSTTAIFLAMIVGLLIANEFLQHRYSSLKLLLSLFALVTLSFLTFFLPVLTGWINSWIFVTGALLTVVLVWKIACLILQNLHEPSPYTSFTLSSPAFVLVGLCTAFYFFNWIPPIPLSLQFGGIYQHIEKYQDQYLLTYENSPWYVLWKRADDRIGTGTPVYAFSSVFAPATLHTTIYHHWEWRPPGEADFITTDRIPIFMTGGREHGFRMMTMKQRLQPGEWRINVETEDGRLIGRIPFSAETNYSPSHDLTTIRR